jgi:hypothetical protein
VENERLISEFNEAKFQIFRLHNIWLDCKTLRRNGDLNSWRWALEDAEAELFGDAEFMGKQDEKAYVKKLKSINKLIAKTAQLKNPRMFFLALKEKELFLRHIQDIAGKGSRRRSEDSDFSVY